MGFAREALNKEVALRKYEQEDMGSIPSLYKCFFSRKGVGRMEPDTLNLQDLERSVNLV